MILYQKWPLTWWGGRGSNPRPRDYEITLSHKHHLQKHHTPAHTNSISRPFTTRQNACLSRILSSGQDLDTAVGLR